MWGTFSTKTVYVVTTEIIMFQTRALRTPLSELMLQGINQHCFTNQNQGFSLTVVGK